MSRWLIAGFILATLGGGVLGWVLHTPHPPSVAVQVAQAAVTTATRQAAKAETVYVHDTLTFTKLRAHYDTVRSTINVHDTVAVQQFVTLADSTIQTCSTALRSCGATVVAQNTVTVTQRRLLDAVMADRPSRLRAVLTDAKWAALGFVAGRVAPRVPVPLFHLTF